MSSIIGSINLAATTPSPVSPDKIDTYKAALLKKLDEIQEKAEKKVKERFSDIIERAAAPTTDPNQVRYEVKTMTVDLLNLFRGKEKAKEYKFEPKEDVVWVQLIENIQKLESLILQASDLRFKKFKQEIQGCKNMADVKKTIQNAKQFVNAFIEIMQRERKLPGSPEAGEEPLPLVPLVPVSPKPIHEPSVEEPAQLLAKGLKEKISDKSLHPAIDELLELMQKDEELSRFLKEENHPGAIELVLYLLENKKEAVLAIIKGKNIADLKFELMFNLNHAFRELGKKIFYVSPGSGTTLAEVEKIEKEYHELKQLYYDYQKMAKNLDASLSPVEFDGESMEKIMQKQEAKFAWLKPHRIVTAKLEEIEELKDNDQMISSLLSNLDMILKHTLKIKDDSVKKFLERKLYWFVHNIHVHAENVETARKVLDKLTDPLFKEVRELLEKKIKEASGKSAKAVSTEFQKYCESLREEMREVISADAASAKEDKKTADSRIMAMNGLINFALDNPELFQEYFKPEHRKAVIRAILAVLKDKNLFPSLASKDSAELMTFYSKIYTKIKAVFEAEIQAQQ